MGKWLNIVTGIGTLVALVGLLYLYGSLSDARQAAKISHDALVMDQRAWVAPISGTVTLDQKHAVRVDVIFQNIGKTPALNVSTILDWKNVPISPLGLPLDLSYSSAVRHVGHGTLYPNAKEAMFAASQQIPNAEVLDQIRNEQTVFYFFGSIDYTDIFGAQHTSRLCNIVNTDLATVRQCDQGNEAN